jgi:hypothetical protein
MEEVRTGEMLGSITLPKGALVPGGSEYQGPSDALDRYTTVVEKAWEVVKGARNVLASSSDVVMSPRSRSCWVSLDKPVP